MVVLDLSTDFRFAIAAVTWFSAAIVMLALLLVLRASLLCRALAARSADLQRLRAECPPPRKYTLEWMILWNQAQDAAKAQHATKARDDLNEVASRAGMAEVARARTRRGDTVDRLAAITMLGHLGDAQAAPALRDALDSSSGLVSIAAARALLQIDPGFAERFVSSMSERADWPPGTLVAIVREECKTLEAALLEACRTAPLPRARVIVPYLRYLSVDKAIPALRRLLQMVTDAETLAAALKVLGAIGSAADGCVAAKFTADERWQVRVQAANALGALGAPSHVALLAAMLNDTHWWVRHRAAQALAAISARCDFDLAPVLAHREDAFARDALVQAIAERGPLLQRGAAS